MISPTGSLRGIFWIGSLKNRLYEFTTRIAAAKSFVRVRAAIVDMATGVEVA